MSNNFNPSLNRLSVKGFREVREIPGAAPTDRFAGVPVTGDSLKHLGILHGDIVIIRFSETHAEGQLCAWETPHGRTVKFAADNFGDIQLHNGAEWVDTWPAGEIKLLGVAVRVERDLEVNNGNQRNN